MELRFTPTDDDLRNLMRVSARWGWNTVQFLLSFVPISFLGAAMVNAAMPIEGWICMGLALAIAVAGYEIPRFEWRRLARSSPAMKGERVLSITDQGVSATYPMGRAQYVWSAFTRYRETEALFALFFSPRQVGFWIPKKAMAADQIEDLRKLLKARVGTN